MRFGLREIVFLMVLMAVPVAAFWFVFSPQNEEIEQATKEIAQKEAMLESLSEATAHTADLAMANDEIREEIELIEARLPSTKEIDKILEQVAELARANRLEIPRFKPARPATASAYMEQPLEISVRGTFERFYSFLLELEQLDRITRMPNLKIVRSTKEDGAIEAFLTLAIYFEYD